MGRFTALRAWFQARPQLTDGLLALVLAAVTVAIPLDASADQAAWAWALRLLAVAACLSLVVRRVWPLPVWAFTLFATCAAAIAQLGPSGSVLALLVALYTVGTRYPVKVSLPIGLASGLLVVVAPFLVRSSAWETNSANALVAWSVLATVIGTAVRAQRRVVAEARERARVAEESREEEAQRRVAEERMRIARELHDLVAHQIAVVNVQAGAAEHLLASDPAGAREAIGHVRAASAEVLDEMSTLLGVLRTPSDQDSRRSAQGLASLDALVESFRRTGLHLSVRRAGDPVELAPLVDVTTYRVIEEALTNAQRHGCDGSAELSITQTAATTAVEVRNRINGSTTGSSGYGLIGMRERVTAIGGAVHAGPDESGWYVVHADIPTITPMGSDT